MQDTTETQFTHLIICYNIIIFSHRSFQLIQLKKKRLDLCVRSHLLLVLHCCAGNSQGTIEEVGLFCCTD